MRALVQGRAQKRLISIRSAVATVLVCAMTGAGCQGTPPTTSSNPLKPTTFYNTGVTAFVLATKTVEAVPVTGTKQPGHPSAGSGSLTVTATAAPNVVNGGGTIVTLHGSAPFSKVLVSVVNGGTVIDGYYEIDLASSQTDQDVLVQFVQAIPAPTFDVQFQAVSPAGAVSQPGVFSASVASDSTTLIPSVVASYSPSPVPFLNGAPCTITNQLGCLWEFTVVLHEFNGLAINPATLTETYTFADGTVTTNEVAIIIPGHGIGTVVRNIACGSATVGCVAPGVLAGGTYTFSVNGTDINGNAFTFTGPVLTLLGR